MIKKNKKNYILLSVFLVLITCIFVSRYIKNESPVYIFDYSGYHELYKIFSKDLINSPISFIKDVISSIRNADYNCAPILLLIPFYAIFKTSRIGYILGICLVYVIPTIILTALLVIKLIFKNDDLENKNKKNFIIFLFLVSFLYTRWWSPSLRGLPDIIAVIPILIATFISFKYSLIEKQKIYIPILLGTILYLPFLFRRYFVYAVIGFYMALGIRELIRFLKEKNNKKEKFKNALKNFLIAGFTTGILLLIVQLPLVKTILSQNYSQDYSAFQDSALNHIVRTIDEFGYIILFFVFIGIIYTFKIKEHRENGLFCLLNIIVSYGTFMTVQAMGVHHYLIISPWIFILFIYGIYAIWKLLRKDIIKNIWLIIVIAFMTLNFATTYVYRTLKIPIFTQNNKYCKFYYENFDELERLITDINELIIDKDVKFSALASSEILSDNLLELLGTEKMKRSIVYTSAIDLRDGINFNSLMSDYIIVTDIAQTGTSVTGQRVVSVPNDEIIKGTSIGKAYTRISNEYILSNGVKAYIYEKNRSFTEDEVNEYMEILENYYPDWKEKYTEFDKGVLMGSRVLGEKIGDARRYKYNVFYISPGFTPTEYIINIHNKVEKLKFKLYIDEYGVDTNTEDYGNVNLIIKKDDDIIYNEDVLYNQPQEVELDVSNSVNLKFIVDKNGKLSWDNLYIELKDVICKSN